MRATVLDCAVTVTPVGAGRGAGPLLSSPQAEAASAAAVHPMNTRLNCFIPTPCRCERTPSWRPTDAERVDPPGPEVVALVGALHHAIGGIEEVLRVELERRARPDWRQQRDIDDVTCPLDDVRERLNRGFADARADHV